MSEKTYQLTIGGLTKQEAKDMVKHIYGFVMWQRADGKLFSYPRGSLATISQET